MKKRWRREKCGPFVMMPFIIIKSQAWKSLSPVSCKAYMELASGYNGRNNGMIVKSARQIAEALGVSKGTSVRALRQLRDHGFIKLGFEGSFRTRARLASTYLLTLYRDDRTGELPTKDFLNWTARPVEFGENKPKNVAGARSARYAASVA